MAFSYALHTAENEKILAITDIPLVGKSFEEGELQLNVTEQFYGSDRCSREEAIRLIKGSTIINAVGKDIVRLLIDENIIEREMVLFVKGVPHAQVVLL